MCIPGDNRVYVLGLQCTGDEEETVRGRNSIFHHSPWERNSGGEGTRKKGGGHPSNSARDRQTYRVLSRYSVHRIDPQCVLTNTTQLPPHWFRVCRRSPLTAPARLPPIPAHRHWNRRTDRDARVCFFFSGQDAHSHAIKSKLFYRPGESRDLTLSSEAGMGERCVSFVYNQVRSLWLMLLPQGNESGPRQHTVMWEDAHIPVPGQSENTRIKF